LKSDTNSQAFELYTSVLNKIRGLLSKKEPIYGDVYGNVNNWVYVIIAVFKCGFGAFYKRKLSA
jgi:hypothetical protein